VERSSRAGNCEPKNSRNTGPSGEQKGSFKAGAFG
jgi:hypothetical protein